MNIDTPESRKRARALLLLGLDALDAFDREQKWADDRGRFSQEIADRRRAEARVRGEELAGRFNALKREYESPCEILETRADAWNPTADAFIFRPEWKPEMIGLFPPPDPYRWTGPGRDGLKHWEPGA